MRDLILFVRTAVRSVLRGSADYYLWVAALTVLSLVGAAAFVYQTAHGLVTTAMTDHVSWGAYIANFAFLVGMAVSAVMVVIPVYLYKVEALRDIVPVAEVMAIASVVMCLLFVIVGIGRPDRFWHLMPPVGVLNFPTSLLSWDVIVLNGYLFLNVFIVGYLTFTRFRGRKPNPRVYLPPLFVQMAWGIGLVTVEAFLFTSLGARPHWNTAILAPRFLASAFVSGPAFLIIALKILRAKMGVPVKDEAIAMLRRVMAVTMPLSLFLLAAEIFPEFYTNSAHSAAARYLFFGLKGHYLLVPFIWTAVVINIISAVIVVSPTLSVRPKLLNAACVMGFIGIWIEKGMGHIVPGFIPGPLGEVVDYSPNIVEILVCAGVWAFGMLVFTALLKVVMPIELGLHRAPSATADPPPPVPQHVFP